MRELTGHTVFAFEGDDADEVFAEVMDFLEENQDSFVSMTYTNYFEGDALLHVYTVVA